MIKAHKNNSTIVILSVCVLLTIQPYITWSIVKPVNQLMGIIAFLVSLKYYKYVQSKRNIQITIFFIVCILYFFLGGTTYSGFSLFPVLPLMYILLPDNIKILVFDKFVKIFSYILFLGLITYFIRFIVSLPSFKILPLNAAKEIMYSVYLFDVSPPQILFPRYMSMFDEPGVVGTICAMLISYKRIELRTFSGIVLMLSGLFSFSLAFYIILFLNIAFNQKTYTRILFLTVSLFLLTSEAGIFDTYVFSRLKIVDGKLSGDNRVQTYFSRNYDYFVEKGGDDLIFGRGPGSDVLDDKYNAGGSSYKYLVYRHGIVGVSLFLLFFIFVMAKISFSFRGVFFLIVFILLAYQRPDVFLHFNIVIFIGGLLSIEYEENIKKKKLINTA